MFKSGSLAAFAVIALFASNALAVGPSIGVATAVGTFSVDESPVVGSVNLSDGAKLQTTTSPSDVRLQNGAEVRLATRSAGTFFNDHISLDRGAVRVANFSGLTVNVNQLQIVSDDPGAQAVIRMQKKTIEIASIGGDVRVMDSGLLTRVSSGTKMSFQSGANPDTAQTQPQSQTGAAPAPTPGKMPSDQKTFLWVIGITAVAALAIGLTAAAQGKSPF
jgi:hypothetical protein